MSLWDNITIERYDYTRQYRVPYCIDRNTPLIPCSKVKMYMLTKVWNKCHMKARRLYSIMKKMRKYDKVKLHNGCVYASRRYR